MPTRLNRVSFLFTKTRLKGKNLKSMNCNVLSTVLQFKATISTVIHTIYTYANVYLSLAILNLKVYLSPVQNADNLLRIINCSHVFLIDCFLINTIQMHSYTWIPIPWSRGLTYTPPRLTLRAALVWSRAWEKFWTGLWEVPIQLQKNFL